MHLKQLKLVGFKSFVDPTVVPFPSQLVAVVGPNGCGKSNIIDALRWVLGESSAKNLRGEAMTDVIFNGSSQRKALGQASVELVFDNSLGRMGGAYAQYAEVAIKRVVTRDGDSSYYLNGARCRRRDVTDLFLGTGAGARGYSIIGQGTISRLIEARPEELRVFLEEAAGVSKYKERRKETLQRMEHCRENLLRVGDIREELGKQLERLERQAKQAERYTRLKEEERRCKAEILVLKWRELQTAYQAKLEALSNLALDHEKLLAQIRELEKNKIDLQEQWSKASTQQEAVQARVYQLGTEIARLEESIQQQQREQKRLQAEIVRLEQDKSQLSQQLLDNQQALQASQDSHLVLNLKLEEVQGQLRQIQGRWHESQQRRQDSERAWQEGQLTLSQQQGEARTKRLELSHCDQQIQQTQQRLDKLDQESLATPNDSEAQLLEHLAAQVLELQTVQIQAEEAYQNQVEQEQQLLRQASDLSAVLMKAQDSLQKKTREHAALEASQQAALGYRAGKQTELGQDWKTCSHLVDHLQVEPEWQRACEALFARDLEAFVLDQETFLALKPADLPLQSKITVLQSKSAAKRSWPRLVDRLPEAVPALLPGIESIYLADTLEEAWALLPQLAKDESLLTKEGYWLSLQWFRGLVPQSENEEGLLRRQQKIAELADELEQAQTGLDELCQQRDSLQQQVQQNQMLTEKAKQQWLSCKENLRDVQAELQAKRQAWEYAQQKRAQQGAEKEELLARLQLVREQRVVVESDLAVLNAKIETLEELALQTEAQRRDEAHHHQSLQQELESMQTLVHQTELASQQVQNKVAQLRERQARDEERLLQISERLVSLTSQHDSQSDADQTLAEQLTEKVSQFKEGETQLAGARELVSQMRLQLDEADRQLREKERMIQHLSEQQNTLKMEAQTLSVRAETQLENLQSLEVTLAAIEAEMTETATLAEKEQALLDYSDKIKRLGAINLAAIEEYQQEGERKGYLDSQHADLSAALESLEKAIAEIDQETTARLAETFQAVNQGFQTLFPRLFGGGRAELILTSEDLLEAGIVVMAQPPGKRNSTIHLLSGGEKAMTAVALVFAIFQLNPSPFCMLDEVDAPLDDVNVGRFCDMVKEMSQFVQFLFITHNKVTMELADHLIGVTMREPGVSRLVAVDVQQALAME